MYKPLQKKNSSWTPTTAQKKSKSPSKLGHFSIQPKPNQKSSQSQEIGEYSRDSADRLAANVMRSLEAKGSQETETPTVQPQSESRISVADVVGQRMSTLTPRTLTPQVRMTSEVVPENPIQRQCADCASEQQEQSAEAEKEVEQISLAANGIQAKVTVGAPGDKYEVEADTVARQVMSMPAPVKNQPIQREGIAEENVEEVQAKPIAAFITPLVQREMALEKQEEVQAKATSDGAFETSSNVETQLNTSKGGGSPLSNEVRSFMEPRFGADFSSVRVHTDSAAVQMSQELGAQAFTHGSDVYFGEGKSPGNNELTAHELTHVVQQNGTTIERKEASNKVQKQDNESLHQPIVENAPASAISIRDFIALVEAEERKYSPEEQTNTKLMITRLRKIFYDREGWDNYLIEGAKDIEAPYTTEHQEKERFTLAIPFWFNDFDVVRQEHNVKDSQGNTPDIASNQEISLEDGSYIDLGHVFAGLDALNYPQSVQAPVLSSIGIDDNVDAVTWVGDLGSVLAEIQFEWIRNDNQISSTEMQAIINEYASPQDMLGNIDTYVIDQQFDIDETSGGRKVSEILREYYLNGSTDQGTPSRDRRYSIFAQAVGLNNWDGTNFSNESEWIDRYTDQVNDAAALYVGANSEGTLGLPGRVGFVLGMSTNAGARTLVETFLNALKQRIALEPTN
ncbi:hypothetical protein MC7420_3112 [Coleofasciculus chthonoplastes PCC 7420]|uniref:eCIS core domain-containing protein n=1 Tax=Coleofasciculus chthonoplastes PCC 7420 TaxID=118168 RepID=B4VKD6_9CYAN|nr:DUF4157 domain-containing protein [Coleofasciculus chthonoplastes]EDX77788.1 hypothetical protein MC7420_3112 [Coleofasciculus chthonoplastes PCC 7420]